ncbi:M20 family metallopeptidase [Haloterrigena alkaliphila]|uniref:M20 family metallopeptidase n=1 Tax=Haloterrigena alkaliphila TaxID=2816475 RepID=UPI001CFF6753|nr:M20/M25/M40 family metallo-hydrolase [Haloterrigena alkaliphila]UHQ95292.1 M20/M25/M40 family metallo-hydrolase [Haloterrigena alkaliphila]
MTDDSGEFEAYVADHRADLIDLALDLLAVDTTNPPGDTREIISLLEEYLSPLPVDVERFAVDPAKPNLLVTLPGTSNRTLLYNGHLDTVPFDADAWSYDPLGERVDDRVYGRGATDMKGAIAAMLFAIRAFAETDTEPPVDLAFAFVSDEEVGGDAGLPALLEADQLDADACVIGEPTCESDRHSVTVADRGSIWLTLEATGEGAHGSRPVLGENAIDRLYDAVATLRERFGTRRLELEPTLEPIVDESIAFYEPMMGAETARELFETPTINLGILEGGDAINSVPRAARAEIDIRLTAGVRTPDLLSEIRECVADCEGITVADVSWSVGTAEPIDSPLVETVVSSAEAITGERVYRRSATGGGDAKRLRNAGVPTVEFALGTDTVHAVDEYTTVDALVGNATVYARLPEVWASAVDGTDPSDPRDSTWDSGNA